MSVGVRSGHCLRSHACTLTRACVPLLFAGQQGVSRPVDARRVLWYKERVVCDSESHGRKTGGGVSIVAQATQVSVLWFACRNAVYAMQPRALWRELINTHTHRHTYTTHTHTHIHIYTQRTHTHTLTHTHTHTHTHNAHNAHSRAIHISSQAQTAKILFNYAH
jgi:hypothetical protein